MSKFTKLTRYECAACNMVHDEFIDAQKCCEPNEVDCYYCNVCNEESQDFPPDNHECSEGAVFRFNQRELEKNGQTRFV